jgi:hypothetical protein
MAARMRWPPMACMVAAATLATAATDHQAAGISSVLHGKPAREGFVSSTQSDATLAGVQMLELGGNAADAAAAVQFALAVTQPQSTGIGGGCFIMRRDGLTGAITALDGREEAPDLFHPNVFCADEDCLLDPECACLEGPIAPASERAIGGLSVGVPGVVAAAARLVADNGSLPLATVLGPAISLAEAGFVMYTGMHSSIASSAAKLRRFAATAELYLAADGATPRVPVGELFTNPDMAATLSLLAAGGPAAFYTEGPLPAEVAAAARDAVNENTGKYGLMSLEDVEGYAAVYRQPVVSSYRGREIAGMPMPSSGGASLALALNYLEGWDVEPSSRRFGMRPEHIGRFIDAQVSSAPSRSPVGARTVRSPLGVRARRPVRILPSPTGTFTWPTRTLSTCRRPALRTRDTHGAAGWSSQRALTPHRPRSPPASRQEPRGWSGDTRPHRRPTRTGRRTSVWLTGLARWSPSRPPSSLVGAPGSRSRAAASCSTTS